jgi:hypothetical protein
MSDPLEGRSPVEMPTSRQEGLTRINSRILKLHFDVAEKHKQRAAKIEEENFCLPAIPYTTRSNTQNGSRVFEFLFQLGCLLVIDDRLCGPRGSQNSRFAFRLHPCDQRSIRVSVRPFLEALNLLAVIMHLLAKRIVS